MLQQDKIFDYIIVKELEDAFNKRGLKGMVFVNNLTIVGNEVLNAQITIDLHKNYFFNNQSINKDNLTKTEKLISTLSEIEQKSGIYTIEANVNHEGVKLKISSLQMVRIYLKNILQEKLSKDLLDIYNNELSNQMELKYKLFLQLCREKY